jgi:hypothetical protein
MDRLTEKEIMYYANYALIDVCDDCSCGEYTPIKNYHDGRNYLTWAGNRLYCLKCLKQNEFST